MRRFRQLGLGVSVAIFLSLTVVAASTGVANAGTVGSCKASGVLATCAVSGAPVHPVFITAIVKTKPRTSANINWNVVCTQGTSQKKSSGSFTAKTPFTHSIPHPFTRPDECSIVVIAGLAEGRGRIHLFVSSASSMPIKGFDGKCAADASNSSAAGTKIELSTCDKSASQNWTFPSGELRHNGKCMSAKGSGGRGSKVILSPCKAAPNQEWTHNSHREYVLKAHGSKLCLEDPGSSKKNGTQLVVNSCKNRADQHWSLP